jgi:NitT/TauT family transport system substrate-binding protein
LTVYSDAIIQHSAGVNTKVVYNIESSYNGDAIIREGNSPLDIKEKNISVDGINSFSHLFILKLLEKVSFSKEDLEFVNMPVQNVSIALQKGEIFAGHIYDPFVTDAVNKVFKENNIKLQT